MVQRAVGRSLLSFVLSVHHAPPFAYHQTRLADTDTYTQIHTHICIYIYTYLCFCHNARLIGRESETTRHTATRWNGRQCVEWLLWLAVAPTPSGWFLKTTFEGCCCVWRVISVASVPSSSSSSSSSSSPRPCDKRRNETPDRRSMTASAWWRFGYLPPANSNRHQCKYTNGGLKICLVCFFLLLLLLLLFCCSCLVSIGSLDRFQVVALRHWNTNRMISRLQFISSIIFFSLKQNRPLALIEIHSSLFKKKWNNWNSSLHKFGSLVTLVVAIVAHRLPFRWYLYERFL